MGVVIDTNIITKILTANQVLADKVWATHERTDILVPEPVHAEVKTFCVLSPDPTQAWDAFKVFKDELNARIIPCSLITWETAGERFAGYLQKRPTTQLQCAKCGTLSEFHCPQCKEPITSRQHILVDFLIGALALIDGEKELMTIDKGIFKTYFPELKLM